MLFRSASRALRIPHFGAAPLMWCLLVLTWSGTTLAALTHTELISDVLHGREPGLTVRPPATDDAFDKTPASLSPTHDSPLQRFVEVPTLEECDGSERELALTEITLDSPAAAETCLCDVETQRAEARRDAWVRDAEHESEQKARLRAESDWQAERRAPHDPLNGVSPYSAYLHWLKDYQEPKGFWSASLWHLSESVRAKSAHTTGNVEGWGLYNETGPADGDLEATALASLVFTGAGYDHKSGDYRNACRQAILWLRAGMDEHGRLKGARGIRDHALAATAFCENYSLSGDSAVQPLAEKSISALLAMRVTESGWGERDGVHADVVSTLYAVYALKSAELAGLKLDTGEIYKQVGRFLNQVLAEQDGRYTVRCHTGDNDSAGGFHRGPICAAAWVCTALYVNHADLRHAAVKDLSRQLTVPENLPAWEHGRVDYQYWLIGSLALYQVGGKHWKAWSDSLSKALLGHQRGYHPTDKANGVATAEHGSWDAVDLWLSGGRVAATCYAALSLLEHYKYLRLKGDAED